MKFQYRLFTLLVFLFAVHLLNGYPIDGYNKTRISRLLYWQHQLESGSSITRFPVGGLADENSIQLNLCSVDTQSISGIMSVSKSFQKSINAVIPSGNYSLAVLDMTDPSNLIYAAHRETVGYQPGSVGKIAVLNAIFYQLQLLFPNSFDARVELLRDKVVDSRYWGTGDHHTIPIYNQEKDKLVKRQVIASDHFSLYEWIDHMTSVSNNGAASVLWREALLMNAFGKDYFCSTDYDAEEFFKNTPRDSLTQWANDIVNLPLRELGITKEEWRLGSFFTSSANKYVGDIGGSIGTPAGLMKYLVQLEQGEVIDQLSSLEMKKLLYLTERRIRYAYSKSLNEARIYFKSGSLYKCDRSVNPDCQAYAGNVYNYMNSVILVEQPSGIKYIACLMTNVLNVNSAGAHMALATKLDQVIASRSQD